MFLTLNDYLYAFKSLGLPGIGSFSVMSRSAQNDVADSSLHAPALQVQFEDKEIGINDDFYKWISYRKGISKEDAVLEFSNFIDHLKRDLQSGGDVAWTGLGVLKNEEGNIVFSSDIVQDIFTPVHAAKVVRENETHDVLVGERQTTSDVMKEELLQEDNLPRRTKYIFIWLLLFATLAAVAFHLYKNGFNISSIGNQQKIETAKPADTYKFR